MTKYDLHIDDLLWNLIPADHSLNSSKCDKLPPIERYFDPYFELQALGLRTVLNNAFNKNTEKLLQDYLIFIPDLFDFANLDTEVLKARLKATLHH